MVGNSNGYAHIVQWHFFVPLLFIYLFIWFPPIWKQNYAFSRSSDNSVELPETYFQVIAKFQAFKFSLHKSIEN